MKKKLFSAAAAGALLLAGTGAANATQLIGIGPTGVQGDLTITGFAGGGPNALCTACMITFDNLAGTGGLTNANITLTGTGGGTVSPLYLFDPTLDLKFEYSTPTNTTDVKRFQMSFTSAKATVDAALTPSSGLTFGPTASDSTNALLAGSQIVITYSGGYSLMGASAPGSGTLTLTAQPTPDKDTITFLLSETLDASCTTSNPCVSFRAALKGLDANTSKPGTIDGHFLIPEPASLALMGIGIAGLGLIRRKKAA